MQLLAKEAATTSLKENCCSVDTRGGGGGRRDLQINKVCVGEVLSGCTWTLQAQNLFTKIIWSAWKGMRGNRDPPTKQGCNSAVVPVKCPVNMTRYSMCSGWLAAVGASMLPEWSEVTAGRQAGNTWPFTQPGCCCCCDWRGLSPLRESLYSTERVFLLPIPRCLSCQRSIWNRSQPTVPRLCVCVESPIVKVHRLAK